MNEFARSLLLRCEKGAAMILIVVHIGVLFSIIRSEWPDIPPTGWALAAFSAALVVIPEMYLLERLCGFSGAFDFRGIGKAYVIIFGLIYLFTLGLFALEVRSQIRSEASDKQWKAEQKAFYDKLHQINHP